MDRLNPTFHIHHDMHLGTPSTSNINIALEPLPLNALYLLPMRYIGIPATT